MRTKGWNLAIVDALAEELNVDRATIYRCRSRAQRWTRDQLRPANIETWRVQQVQFLADTALEARKDKDYGAAARCIDIQAKIIGTIAPTKVDVTSTTRLDVSPAVVALVSERLALASSPRLEAIEAEAEVVGASAGESDG
jgi:hypothetical protein